MFRPLAVCMLCGALLAVTGCGGGIVDDRESPTVEVKKAPAEAAAKNAPKPASTQGGAGGGGKGNPFASGQGQGQQEGGSQYGGGGGGADGAFAGAGQGQQQGGGQYGGAAAGGADGAFAGAGQGQQQGAAGQYGGAAAGGADGAFAGAGQGQQQGAAGQYGGSSGGGGDGAFAGAGQGQQQGGGGSYGGTSQGAGNPFAQLQRRRGAKDEPEEPELSPDEAAERAVNKFLDALDHEEYDALAEVISVRARGSVLKRLRGGKSDEAEEALVRLRDEYARGGRSVVLKVMPMPDKLERRVSIGIPASSGDAQQGSPLAHVGVRQEGKAWRIISIQRLAAG